MESLAILSEEAVINLNARNLSGAQIEGALDTINILLRAYDVEIHKDHDIWKNYSGNIAASYVNMGDTYLQTIIYDWTQDKFILGCIGDWIEKYEAAKEKEQRIEEARDAIEEVENRSEIEDEYLIQVLKLETKESREEYRERMENDLAETMTGEEESDFLYWYYQTYMNNTQKA